MKLVKKYPQTLATICVFDDGSVGVKSWQYDSLVGGLVRRENHTLTPDQEAAVARFEEQPSAAATET